jgi:hypothetical protein
MEIELRAGEYLHQANRYIKKARQDNRSRRKQQRLPITEEVPAEKIRNGPGAEKIGSGGKALPETERVHERGADRRGAPEKHGHVPTRDADLPQFTRVKKNNPGNGAAPQADRLCKKMRARQRNGKNPPWEGSVGRHVVGARQHGPADKKVREHCDANGIKTEDQRADRNPCQKRDHGRQMHIILSMSAGAEEAGST